MADKRIDQLTAATSLGDSDLLVVEQESAAKKATGEVVSNYINSKFGLSGMASDISTLQAAVAGKQDALTLPLPISQGGTNATTVGNARVNLGLGTAATANIDETLTVPGGAADANVVGVQLREIVPASLSVNMDVLSKFSKTINGGNAWQNLTGQAFPVLVEIPSWCKRISFVAKSGGVIAFLSSDDTTVSPSFSASYPGRIVLADDVEHTYDVESDMLYMYVLRTSGAGADISITDLTFYSIFTDDTLSIQGAAADAKATGDLIAEKTNTVDTTAASTYSYLLANVSGEVSRNVSVGEGWLDLPVQKGGVFFNQQYGTGHDIQIYIDNTYGVEYNRIVRHTSRSVFRDWASADPISLLKVVVTGDSICRGGRNSGRGFIGDIGCVYANIGIGGATISNVHDSSTSTDSVHPMSAANIPDTIVKYAQQTAETWYIEPDAIIAEGGINDLFDGASLGTVPTSPATDDTAAAALDLSTVTGGLGFMFYQMIKLFPNAHRFFLISNKNATRPWTPGVGGFDQTQLHDAIVEMCELYGVDVIDVYNKSFVASTFSQYVSPIPYSQDHTVTDLYYIDNDKIHPLALGYKAGYAPLVKEALRKAKNL